MPQSFLKKNKKYIENHKKQSFFLFFTLIIIFLMIIFNVFNFLSNIIIGKVNSFSFINVEIPSYNVYAISIFESFDDEEVNTTSKMVKENGGAGTIYCDGKSYVLLCMYPSLIEAVEVKENLQNDNENVKIINFEIQSSNYSCKSNEKEVLSNCIKFFRQTFNNLYNLSINFDKKLININMAKQEIANNIKDCINNLNNIEKVKSIDENLKLGIKEYLKNEKESLFEILLYKCNNKELENMEFSSLIKQVYIKTILLNQALACL